ncbi:MAG: hypothetical protein KJ970_17205 [Candidatus Eisenbacteria bacterium]|uniref:Uncharacterized protein n=1 Tax=Eiseniibacteriota bacterium TaxID=2212470 RepID=A0A948RZ58_UNCEI|nr:hypothetical protein [Candidatus Eisenbacteria bacterium]
MVGLIWEDGRQVYAKPGGIEYRLLYALLGDNAKPRLGIVHAGEHFYVCAAHFSNGCTHSAEPIMNRHIRESPDIEKESCVARKQRVIKRGIKRLYYIFRRMGSF